MIELAGCVIRDTEGKLLLLHRNTEKLTQWELPGGKVDPEDKDHAAAAIREIKEELGIDVRILKHLGQASFEANDTVWLYNWFEAEQIDANQNPAVMEPETFDRVDHIHPEDLRGRDDLSLNVVNLLASGAL